MNTLAGGMCSQLKSAIDGSQHKSAMNWLYLIIALIPTASESLGIYPVLNIILAELFPTDIRDISVGIVMGVTFVVDNLNMMAYPMASNNNAFSEIMFVYGVVAAFMTVWAIATVKDTDNMSLVEIEKLFRGSFRRVRDSFRRASSRRRQAAKSDSRGQMESDSRLSSLKPSLPSLQENVPLLTPD